jgi:hypothetical protein
MAGGRIGRRALAAVVSLVGSLREHGWWCRATQRGDKSHNLQQSGATHENRLLGDALTRRGLHAPRGARRVDSSCGLVLMFDGRAQTLA